MEKMYYNFSGMETFTDNDDVVINFENADTEYTSIRLNREQVNAVLNHLKNY